jgi:hypothetical protein
VQRTKRHQLGLCIELNQEIVLIFLVHKAHALNIKQYLNKKCLASVEPDAG